jgi:hypothetical protein
MHMYMHYTCTCTCDMCMCMSHVVIERYSTSAGLGVITRRRHLDEVVEYNAVPARGLAILDDDLARVAVAYLDAQGCRACSLPRAACYLLLATHYYSPLATRHSP